MLILRTHDYITSNFTKQIHYVPAMPPPFMVLALKFKFYVRAFILSVTGAGLKKLEGKTKKNWFFKIGSKSFSQW
jgi:hypothetical protein